MTTDLFGSPPASLASITTPKHHGRRAGTLGIVAAIALFVGGMGATASADGSNTDTTAVTLGVTEGFTINGLTLTLPLLLPGGGNGAPGQIVGGNVSMTVLTNTTTGYQVTLAAPNMTNLPGLAVIPIGDLKVTDTSPGNLLTTVNGVPVTTGAQPVFTKAGVSAQNGDTVANSFSLLVPAVPTSPAFTTTLTYVAAVFPGGG